MRNDYRQFAEDLQALLAGSAPCPVFEGEAPRNAVPPYVVYTAPVTAPVFEDEEHTATLFLDVWALGSWDGCFEVSQALDAALNGRAYDLPSGALCCDQGGVIFQRMQRDPGDERIRRMAGQYALRWSPKPI